VLGTLGDAYANPVMIDALILEREGITVSETSCYPPTWPAIEDVKQIERWEPWVRAYTAVGEMLQGISFQKTTSHDGYKVLSSLSGSPSPIAAIERPQQSTFVRQMPLVLSWAELRNERATEILAQIDPQYAFWSSIVYLHSDRTKRTLELINILLQFCVYVEMRFKHALACYRPVEYNAQVQPMITTPGHGSFPMGHATQAYAVAYLLKALLNLNATSTKPGYPTVVVQLDRQVARIATNRVVAGVHFPVDSMAGRMLGVALGEYFVGRCIGRTVPKKLMNRRFLATTGIDAAATTDFNPFSATQDLDGTGSFYSHQAGANISHSPLMEHLWDKAREEWPARFL
jgi:membrane-associated phospholipid phosphatase